MAKVKTRTERNTPGNLVTFRSVPAPSEMELVPFQFHKNCNEFRNDPLRRFVTHNSALYHLRHEWGWGLFQPNAHGMLPK